MCLRKGEEKEKENLMSTEKKREEFSSPSLLRFCSVPFRRLDPEAQIRFLFGGGGEEEKIEFGRRNLIIIFLSSLSWAGDHPGGRRAGLTSIPGTAGIYREKRDPRWTLRDVIPCRTYIRCGTHKYKMTDNPYWKLSFFLIPYVQLSNLVTPSTITIHRLVESSSYSGLTNFFLAKMPQN